LGLVVDHIGARPDRFPDRYLHVEPGCVEWPDAELDVMVAESITL